MSRRLDAQAFLDVNERLLAGLPMFDGLPLETLRAFIESCEFLRLDVDEVLLSPHVDNHHLYMSVGGQLVIYVDGIGSANRIEVPAGELVGEVSIVDGQRPTGFVCAATECDVLAIHEDLLWNQGLAIPGVARNFLRQMGARMRDRYVAIQRAAEQTMRLEALERELATAAEIQSSILPMAPLLASHPQLAVAAHLLPAKEIGGDLYDAFVIDEARVCVAIGDVAGKGIPAALFMMRCVTLLRTEMARLRSAKAAISAINATLCEDNPTCMFVTMAIVVIDVRAQTIEYVSGGHDAPLVGDGQGGFTRLPRPRGMMLGVNPLARYDSLETRMPPGTMLVLFTDGVTEAMNADDVPYSESRLLACLRTSSSCSPDEVLSCILQDLAVHVGDSARSDDLTLMALRLEDDMVRVVRRGEQEVGHAHSP